MIVFTHFFAIAFNIEIKIPPLSRGGINASKFD